MNDGHMYTIHGQASKDRIYVIVLQVLSSPPKYLLEKGRELDRVSPSGGMH